MTFLLTSLLPCYYLDQPLDTEELRFVQHTLIGPWARFRTGAAALQQRRVPAVLPLPDTAGGYAQSRAQRATQVRAHLRHAGLRADCGRQVVWVMPADADWDAVFRYAIWQETGLAPFVAQRWFAQGGRMVRGSLRVIDTQQLLRRL